MEAFGGGNRKVVELAAEGEKETLDHATADRIRIRTRRGVRNSPRSRFSSARLLPQTFLRSSSPRRIPGAIVPDLRPRSRDRENRDESKDG